LNGKNPAVGGNTSMQVAVGSAGSGFTGYSFNGGNGYANTVYSHANFLAGKKIKLIAKILGAIEDVESVYTQLQSKRAEYYEYNQ
jgi:outer membrane protein TolC